MSGLTVMGSTPRLGREAGKTGLGGVHRLHLRRADGVRAAESKQATPPYDRGWSGGN
jgi:hypothetical protein